MMIYLRGWAWFRPSVMDMDMVMITVKDNRRDCIGVRLARRWKWVIFGSDLGPPRFISVGLAIKNTE